MPWKESSVMEERLRFVARLLDGETMTGVCREFGISRKTGYKIFSRYKEHGLEALTDRSRRPVRYANQLPPQLESLIVSLKRDKPHWGARKLRELLVRRLAGDVRVPAKSNIHAVLDRLLTSLAAPLMDGPAVLRHRFARAAVTGGVVLETLLRDDDALEAFVRDNVTGAWHASGTCRMGHSDDPAAVTDAAGQVRGVSGLRVVDASLMPEVPCANTNIPTIMMAEKIVAAVLAGSA